MTGSLETLPSREELKERLFDVIDKDGDDLLNKGEMRELAKLVGFDGGDDEWSQEYLKLCEEVGAAPAKGIPKVVVLELLDDRSETGCFCTEEDLQILLRGLEKREVKAVSSSRVEKKSKQVTARRREGRAGDDVFFSGVPIWTTEDAIRSFFQHAGEVLAIRLFRHKDGTSQGMGYVTFGSTKQASRAVASLNQEEMVGYPGYPIQVQAFDHQEEKQKALPARQENRRYVEPPRVARARETREAREAQKTGATGGRRRRCQCIGRRNAPATKGGMEGKIRTTATTNGRVPATRRKPITATRGPTTRATREPTTTMAMTPTMATRATEVDRAMVELYILWEHHLR